MAFHNGRRAREGVFAELKSQAQMDYVPARRCAGSQFYLLAGVLAHNLNREMQTRCHEPGRNATEKRAPLSQFEQVATYGIRLLVEHAVRPSGECEALVVGAGSIGSLCALVLRWWDVAEPTIAELNALRRETVTRGGFGRVTDGVEDEPQAAAYHVVVDAVGTPATRELAMRSVRRVASCSH